jgi:hypothetical protein
MKTQDLFTEQDLVQAVDDLATMPYFPTESRGSVMTLLRKMCPHRTALRWLVAEAVNHVDKWPGLAELRAILCMRYDPADGIDQWSTLPGYRADDAEMKHLEAHERLQANQQLAPESRQILKRLTDGTKSLEPPRRSTAKGAAS